ncbi:hypothetical protein E2C01_072401 [Portunus trituberculatus]|uniref:Uncharacterized protein n=1 Tax=Portunus trituberculatus TaxID=210409 RepID=A0A5B7I2I8_PORTR|nr:hypothetical protein [Portunus trituberculatus]
MRRRASDQNSYGGGGGGRRDEGGEMRTLGRWEVPGDPGRTEASLGDAVEIKLTQPLVQHRQITEKSSFPTRPTARCGNGPPETQVEDAPGEVGPAASRTPGRKPQEDTALTSQGERKPHERDNQTQMRRGRRCGEESLNVMTIRMVMW